MKLTGSYIDANLEEMLDFSARLPFGQRLLVPAVAHFLSLFLPLEVEHLFFITELVTISLFYFVLVRLLEQEFKTRESQVLSWLFILLLPLFTVINYRFTTQGEATFYYPYDSASLFFMAVGFLFCLRAQWRYFIPLVFFATFNRESSILLVLMIPALYWQKLPAIIKPMLLSMLAYFLARIIILIIVQDLPGPIFEWHFRMTKHSYFEVNLLWLLEDQNLFFFIFCFAGLPLFWFAFYDYIPLRYRPLRYVMLFYFLCLLLIGNFMEARIFIEIIVLMYLPVCVATSRWLLDLKPFVTASCGLLYYIDRYAVIGSLTIVILLRKLLNPLVIWLANHL